MPDPPNSYNQPFRASTNAPSETRTSPPRGLPLLTRPDSTEPVPSLSLSLASCKQPPAPAVRFSRDYLPRMHDKISLSSSSDVSVVQKARDTPNSTQRPTVHSFTALSSTHFQTINRPLWTSLSRIPPEHAQVSGVAGNDLDMKLYVFSPDSYIFTGSQELKRSVLAAYGRYVG